MLINKRVEEPYSRLPPDGPLPILSKILVKSKLSKEFFKQTKYIYDPNTNPPERINQEIKKEKTEKNNTQNRIKSKSKNNIKALTNNVKMKRANTPTVKHANLKNLNNQKNIIKNNSNKNIKYNNNNNNLNNIGNRIKNDNIKKNFLNYSNNNEKWIYSENVKNDSDNDNDNKDELNILKEKIFKLENELNKKEKIIELQREERVKLTIKIEELEDMLDSIKSMKKF